MTSFLASESKDYYDKFSDMWTGEKIHYDADENPELREQGLEDDEEADGKKYGDSFRRHFALPASEKLQATFFGYLQRTVLILGKVYIGNTRLCFRSLAAPQTKVRRALI